jgi:hypothetical protein
MLEKQQLIQAFILDLKRSDSIVKIDDDIISSVCVSESSLHEEENGTFIFEMDNDYYADNLVFEEEDIISIEKVKERTWKIVFNENNPKNIICKIYI